MLVVHMTPESVLKTDQYRSWMERFGRSLVPSLENEGLIYVFFIFIMTVVLPQVSVHHRTPDPQRTRLHGAQRAQPQDPGAAEHDPPRDLPTAPDLQHKSTDTVSLGGKKSREPQDES